MKTNFCLLFCILIIFLNGCTKLEVKTNSKEPINVSTSINFNDETFDTNKGEFIIQTGTFSPEITLSNQFPHDNQYRLFVFVDYKLIPVIYKGDSVDFIDLKIGENSKQKIYFSLPDLSIGSHDLLVLSVRNPSILVEKNHVVSPEEYLLAHRARIVVKNNLPSNTISFKTIDTNTQELKMPLILSNTSNTRIEDIASLIDRSENSKIWMHLNGKLSTNYALIALLDNEQVTLKHSFISTANPGTISMEIDITELENHIKGNFILIAIGNPFTVYEEGKAWFPISANIVTIQ